VTPLPAALGGGPLTGWRIDTAGHAATWDSGEGAFLYAGRWHDRGFRAVYASLDPATAMLEVAVHKGFDTLDRVPHVLTAFTIDDPARVTVHQPAAIPNPGWLTSATASRGQRDWGMVQLRAHGFVVLPSAVSRRSWNILFLAGQGLHRRTSQEPLAPDTRLNPPA